jgi:hypothetical protein
MQRRRNGRSWSCSLTMESAAVKRAFGCFDSGMGKKCCELTVAKNGRLTLIYMTGSFRDVKYVAGDGHVISSNLNSDISIIRLVIS